MENPWKSFIKAILDTNAMDSELAKLQKKLDNRTLHVPVEADQQRLLDSVKKTMAKAASSIKLPGLQVPVSISQPAAGTSKNTLRDQFILAGQRISQKLSVASGAMLLYSKTKQSLSEIRELDRMLTRIGRTSGLTSEQLARLGTQAYETAGKYGRAAGEYLSAVEQMSQSGFHGSKGVSLAEQSLLAQSAGGMDAELANQYILATNAAGRLNGEAKQINAVLDGQNSISARHGLAMSDMAAAMNEAGDAASRYRVSIQDLSAMIGTIGASTSLPGSEIGIGIASILRNLQDGATPDMADTLKAANVSMTEFADGSEQLRDPVSILRDLAQAYRGLSETDPLRGQILADIGPADQVNSLLQNMDLFDQMAVDYSEGTGSAMASAKLEAEDLTGSLRSLSNSWTEFVGHIADSGELKAGVDLLNGLVNVLANITSSGETLKITLLAIIATMAQMKFERGGLIRLIPVINNSSILCYRRI